MEQEQGDNHHHHHLHHHHHHLHTDLVPHEDGLSELDPELLVTREDVLQLVEQGVHLVTDNRIKPVLHTCTVSHLGLAEDGRCGLLEGQLVVLDQPPKRGQVVVLAVYQAVDDTEC